MYKEENEALDFIKDFLKSHGLKSTLDCLVKEESYKNIGVEKKRKRYNKYR